MIKKIKLYWQNLTKRPKGKEAYFDLDRMAQQLKEYGLWYNSHTGEVKPIGKDRPT